MWKLLDISRHVKGHICVTGTYSGYNAAHIAFLDKDMLDSHSNDLCLWSEYMICVKLAILITAKPFPVRISPTVHTVINAMLHSVVKKLYLYRDFGHCNFVDCLHLQTAILPATVKVKSRHNSYFLKCHILLKTFGLSVFICKAKYLTNITNGKQQKYIGHLHSVGNKIHLLS